MGTLLVGIGVIILSFALGRIGVSNFQTGGTSTNPTISFTVDSSAFTVGILLIGVGIIIRGIGWLLAAW